MCPVSLRAESPLSLRLWLLVGLLSLAGCGGSVSSTSSVSAGSPPSPGSAGHGGSSSGAGQGGGSSGGAGLAGSAQGGATAHAGASSGSGGPQGGGSSGAGSGGAAGSSAGSAGAAGASPPEGGSLGSQGPSCAAGLLCAGVSCCESRIVPATSFSMGCTADGPNACSPYFPEEQPAHLTFVDAFALDTFEVTVGRFRAFAQAFDGTPPPEGAGAHPQIPGSGWRSEWNKDIPPSQAKLLASLAAPAMFPLGYPTSGNDKTWSEDPSSGDNLPINYVDWPLAFAFCIWDGGRLPTEAEWECAATGGDENRLYPWGAGPFDGRVDPAGFSLPYPSEVGQFPTGQGRWGHLDLAGNLTEWVLDWLNPDWYPQHAVADSCHNCASLEETPGGHRVYRGEDGRAAARGLYPTMLVLNNGFRCARNP